MCGGANEGVLHAQRAVALNPTDPDAHVILGRGLGLQGQLGEAKVELQRALQLDPANIRAREGLQSLSRAMHPANN